MKNKKAKQSKPLQLVTETGLTQSELAAGQAIAQLCPQAVKQYGDYRNGENQFRSAFWSLVVELRKPVTPKEVNGVTGSARVLNGREITLLLLSLGEPKQRVTEFKRIAEMEEDKFKACLAASLSKVEALGVARGTLAIEGEGEDASVVKVGSGKEPNAKPAKAKFHRFAKDFAQAIHELLAESKDSPKATNDDIPYELEGVTADGRAYKVLVFVDSKPVKEKAE